MKHYLITRFNLRNKEWLHSKKNETILDNEWHKTRFNIFENYCFPSIEKQSNKNFKWLVFFDNTTPVQYHKKIKELQNRFLNFIPFFIDGNDVLCQSIVKFINNDKKSSEYVITTRIDNDDLVHTNFIETIQKLSFPSENLVIDLRKGYQLDISGTKKKIRVYTNKFNPFISLVEKDNIQSVFKIAHREWSNEKNLISEEQTPLWIELVHQSNLLNDSKKYLYLTKDLNYHDFGLLSPIHTYSTLGIKIRNLSIQLHNHSFSYVLKNLFRSIITKYNNI